MPLSNNVDAQDSGLQAVDATTGVWNGRTLTAGAGISIVNGDGVSGNPTISASTGSGFVGVQVFGAGAYVYTPTAGMAFVIVELVGGGGGSAAGRQSNGSPGAGGGGYAKFLLTAAQVGASLSGTVGAGGSAGPASSTSMGGDGTATTLLHGSPWTVGGGTGSHRSPIRVGAGGGITPGVGVVILSIVGQRGSFNSPSGGATNLLSGNGGSSFLGLGGAGVSSLIGIPTGISGTGYGAGAAGSIDSGLVGAAGTAGRAIFTEFA